MPNRDWSEHVHLLATVGFGRQRHLTVIDCQILICFLFLPSIFPTLIFPENIVRWDKACSGARSWGFKGQLCIMNVVSRIWKNDMSVASKSSSTTSHTWVCCGRLRPGGRWKVGSLFSVGLRPTHDQDRDDKRGSRAASKVEGNGLTLRPGQSSKLELVHDVTGFGKHWWCCFL